MHNRVAVFNCFDGQSRRLSPSEVWILRHPMAHLYRVLKCIVRICQVDRLKLSILSNQGNFMQTHLIDSEFFIAHGSGSVRLSSLVGFEEGIEMQFCFHQLHTSCTKTKIPVFPQDRPQRKHCILPELSCTLSRIRSFLLSQVTSSGNIKPTTTVHGELGTRIGLSTSLVLIRLTFLQNLHQRHELERPNGSCHC